MDDGSSLCGTDLKMKIMTKYLFLFLLFLAYYFYGHFAFSVLFLFFLLRFFLDIFISLLSVFRFFDRSYVLDCDA
jgi:hypothetical protein